MVWALGRTMGLELIGGVQVSETFNTAGAASQLWVVPAGVTSIAVLMRGAAAGFSNTSLEVGCVRTMRWSTPVTPGEVLTLKVGEKPLSSLSATGRIGGWPDGGDGGSNPSLASGAGLGGGGSTSVYRGATLLAIAGASGGIMKNRTAAYTIYGYQSGNDGTFGIYGAATYVTGAAGAFDLGGKGGTTSGGAGGPRLARTNPVAGVDPTLLPAVGTVAGGAGSFMQGGAGASNDTGSSNYMAGSGGGGGWFGGGGGSSRMQPVDSSGNYANAGGGGGSSYVNSSAGAVPDYYHGAVSGFAGQIIITYTPPGGGTGWSLM